MGDIMSRPNIDIFNANFEYEGNDEEIQTFKEPI